MAQTLPLTTSSVVASVPENSHKIGTVECTRIQVGMGNSSTGNMFTTKCGSKPLHLIDDTDKFSITKHDADLSSVGLKHCNNNSLNTSKPDWASFTHDSETEDTPESKRRFSESERRNLLADNDDYVQLSEDDDDDDDHENDDKSSTADSYKNMAKNSTNFQKKTLSEKDDDDDDDDVDSDLQLEYKKSFSISQELKEYYRKQFEKLLKISCPTASRCNGNLFDEALNGSDAHVQDFFRKSKLDQVKLSKIWSLADVNTDGFLNFDEFVVAMHLIVRCVKGNYDVPDELPSDFRPTLTPPRCPNTSAHQSTMPPSIIFTGRQPTTSSFDDTFISATSSMTFYETMPITHKNHVIKQHQRAPVLPLQSSDESTSQFSSQNGRNGGCIGGGVVHLARPTPRRAVPLPATTTTTTTTTPPASSLDDVERRIQSNKTSLLSPQVLHPPKGPPPPPPPRPIQQLQQTSSSPTTRHARSISLDMNKNRFSPSISHTPVVTTGVHNVADLICDNLPTVIADVDKKPRSYCSVGLQTEFQNAGRLEFCLDDLLNDLSLMGGVIDVDVVATGDRDGDGTADKTTTTTTTTIVSGGGNDSSIVGGGVSKKIDNAASSSSAANSAPFLFSSSKPADRCAALRASNQRLYHRLQRLTVVSELLRRQLQRYGVNQAVNDVDHLVQQPESKPRPSPVT